MITNFNQYITESLKDKMTGKSYEEVFTYDSFKPVLRSFVDDADELSSHKDLEILIEQLPILTDSELEDLRYFVVKEDAFTQDDKGNIIQVKNHIDALERYTKDVTPEIVKIPELTSELIQTILVFKGKKLVIVHAVHGTMIVLNKNIFQ